jgi:hypothetical protein
MLEVMRGGRRVSEDVRYDIAVVIATGGFANNKELLREHIEFVRPVLDLIRTPAAGAIIFGRRAGAVIAGRVLDKAL